MGEGTDGWDLYGGGSPPRVRIDISTFFRSAPSDLLPRLYDDDPLDLRLRCFARRNQLAYLISKPRLFNRALSRTAYAGYSYRGTPPVDAWLEARIDHSIRELLEEDDAGERRNLAVERPAHYAVVGDLFGMEPNEARSSCVAFNALAPDVRRSFFAIAVLGATAQDFARREGRVAESVERDVERALAALIHSLSAKTSSTSALLALRNWPSDW